MSNIPPYWSHAEGCWVYSNGQRWNPSTRQWSNGPNQHQPPILHNVPRGKPSQPYMQHERSLPSSSPESLQYQWRSQPAQGHVSVDPRRRLFSDTSELPSGSGGRRPQPTPIKSVRRNIEGTKGDYEILDPHYRKHKRNFFRKFRVFMILWSQPADDDTLSVVTKEITRENKYGQPVFSKIRRFIVVREGKDKCVCVPIVTYGGHGVSKDVDKSEHAIVYTSTKTPKPAYNEVPRINEKPMRTPIRVATDEKGDKLDIMSRIDYGRVYTIETNVKVKPFGWIHEQSRKDLNYGFLNVFFGEQGYKDLRDAHEQQQSALAGRAPEDDNADEEDEEADEGEDSEEESDEDVRHRSKE